MTKAIMRLFLALAVVFASVACGDSTRESTQDLNDSHESQTDSLKCNFTNESTLYNEWAREWRGKEYDVYYYNSGHLMR